MNSQKPWGLHWFRRDLRVPGNDALQQNWKRTQGRTLGIFCFDSKFLSRDDFSHHRFAFFLKTLGALKQDLQDQGGDLLIVDSRPQDFFPFLLEFLKKNGKPLPQVVTWNRDYEPFARQRDSEVQERLRSFGVDTLHCRDHLLFEPHEVVKTEKPSDFYQVYSPYSRKWFEKLNGDLGLARLQQVEKSRDYFLKKNRRDDLFKMSWKDLKLPSAPLLMDSLTRFQSENDKFVTISIPEGGFFKAFETLESFRTKIEDYQHHRDFPSLSATSRLSLYFKNGSLTVPQVIQHLKLQSLSWKEKGGKVHFLKELAWREFYYAILFHRPEVEKQSFLKAYEQIPWENNEDSFEKWKIGKTGFPIVDAGMRELNSTGWMHNRVRMIVASFLTKDLLIDWKWGENYFMKWLLDGDLAPNNGGWQWAASTGCDPQPYFRIFNPWLQGAKFDPQGHYIKKFIPELSGASAEELHKPEANRSAYGYPAPIVEHSIQRDKALKLYKRNS